MSNNIEENNFKENEEDNNTHVKTFTRRTPHKIPKKKKNKTEK